MATAWNVDRKTGRFVATDPLDVLYHGLTFGTGCWEWQGDKNNKGYGRVAITRDGKRQRFFAHKIAFDDAYGPIPEGMIVRHKCDNKACARWDHLTYGTYSQNGRDAVERGQIKTGQKVTHCVNGHEYTEVNTYRWRGTRQCKACHREKNRLNMRRYAAQKREALNVVAQ